MMEEVLIFWGAYNSHLAYQLQLSVLECDV